MLQSLPYDLLEQILRFLYNDGASVGRLSLCSKSLHQQITTRTQLWKALIAYRWSTSSRYNGEVNADSDEGNDQEECPRRIYSRRHALDRRAKLVLYQMTADLKQSLRIPEDAARIDGNRHVGQAWDHFMWKELLTMRGDALDYLRQEARLVVGSEFPNDSTTLDIRLRSFLAARSLQTIQFSECLYEWKAVQELHFAHHEEETVGGGRVNHAANALMLERYALLINEIQQTPDQLILRPSINIKESVERRIDQLADGCLERIRELEVGCPGGSLTILEQIEVVNEYLFHREGFEGNSNDYYNFRNSLLECVLDTKKGIPITLAILYSCVCRRLNLRVHLVGLPGHLVLGFLTTRHPNEEDAEVKFLDVFHKGELLTVHDCQHICASYGVPWEDKYLRPLPPNQVLQRILNNLANCHFHGLATGHEAFHSDLFFHQRALASIHRQPPAIAAPLVDRVTQELPLTLSPDLLRFYGLLSPSRTRQQEQQENDEYQRTMSS